MQECAIDLQREIVDWNFPHERRSREWGKLNSLWVTKGSFSFPCKSKIFPWMAQQAWWKKIPPQAAKPRVVEFFFTTTAEPWMGKFLTRMGMKMSLEWQIGNFAKTQFLSADQYHSNIKVKTWPNHSKMNIWPAIGKWIYSISFLYSREKITLISFPNGWKLY